jgi:hypothetical protein
MTYDLYATNGLGDGVILNAEGRTSLAGGKREEAFAEDNNGSPAFTGRLAAQHGALGELGVSFYTGIYNSYRSEGVPVDKARRLTLVALDGSTRPFQGRVELRGEMAFVNVDVPEDLQDLFGAQQFGWHVDATMPVWRPSLRGFPEAAVNADVRLEYVDRNVGTFSSTGSRIGDEATAVVVGASFRPVNGTVFKANYRRQVMRDIANNAATTLGTIQVGFATYF